MREAMDGSWATSYFALLRHKRTFLSCKPCSKVYPGTPDAYNYGPICVAESERGRGLAGAMFAELRARLPDREGVAFIRRDNTTSLLAHKKMGMQEVAEFTHGGVGFVVVAYGGPGQPSRVRHLMAVKHTRARRRVCGLRVGDLLSTIRG